MNNQTVSKYINHLLPALVAFNLVQLACLFKLFFYLGKRTVPKTISFAEIKETETSVHRSKFLAHTCLIFTANIATRLYLRNEQTRPFLYARLTKRSANDGVFFFSFSSILVILCFVSFQFFMALGAFSPLCIRPLFQILRV